MNQVRPIRLFRGLAKATPETRARVTAAASEARRKAFTLYNEAKAKAAKAEAKAAKMTKT